MTGATMLKVSFIPMFIPIRSYRQVGAEPEDQALGQEAALAEDAAWPVHAVPVP